MLISLNFIMKKFTEILFLVFILITSPVISFSQEKVIIEHISSEEGISNNLIYCITQDSKGFIWFGTMFGLVRYDGINYKTYRFDPLDTNTLSNDDIISVYEDRDSNLWVGTYNGGVNKFDRHSGVFKRYISNPDVQGSLSDNTVWTIFQDSKGVMWFGTENGGLGRLENGKFKSFKNDAANSESISGNNIRSIAEDNEGNLWLGIAGKGLNKFDPQKNTFKKYSHDSLNSNSLSGNTVTAVFTDKEGIIWAGTGSGLNRFDKSKNEFIRFQRDSMNEYSISNNYILSVKEDGSEHLMIGTQDGLNRFEKATGKFKKYNIFPERPHSRESIIAFIKDRSGVIWASSYLSGLHKIYEKHENFASFLPANNVKSIYRDNSGTTYAGTSNGLEVIDINGNNIITFLHEKNNPNSISSNDINSISEDNAGNIWIGTVNGLNKFNVTSKNFTHYFSGKADENSLSSNNILKVYTDRSGTLWIGTDNGLDRMDANSGKLIHYRNNPYDKNSLSENTVLSIYQDINNLLWVGTYKGLNKLNTETGMFKHFMQDPGNPTAISNNYVFSFCEDVNGNFWIGTGGGLNIFDKESETFFHFTEKDGLPNSVIAGIEESGDGSLWLSTNKGLSQFSIKNRKFRNYYYEDGLQSNMFNTGSYFKTDKGEMLFGGINGYNKFNPTDIIENKYSPDVILTSLTKYEGNNNIKKDISFEKETEINYSDNLIKFGFASTDFSNPEKNEFAYRLEGFDKDWIYTGNSAEAVYTNLDPGKYIFKVKATNSDGIWSEKISSIIVNVNPPYWKTWWFYSLMILVTGGTVFLIYNYRLRQKVKKIIEIEKIKERERELMREQASRDYHDELGHKLTRISMYSRRINKKLRPSANGLTNDLNSIVETSNSLQSSAKDLIWALNPQEDTFYDFAVRLSDFGNELFENTGITFTASGIDDTFRNINLSMNSKRHLIYIFKEGMNNILKYAECTKVDLKFGFYHNDLEILLEDNGIGFDVKNCPKGYGLKNIFLRSKQININVNISSGERTGTKIMLKANIANLVKT